LRLTTGRICIVGDFNMSTIDWEHVIHLSNSTDGVNSHFLTQVVREPTRISHSSKIILDLVFYNCREEIFDVKAVEDFSSDHLAVSFSILTKLN